MPNVFLPAAMRQLVDGQEFVQAEGATVRAVIEDLDERFPGVKERLCDGDGLRPGLAVTVGESVSPLGLLQPVRADDEIHFLPAIGGG